MEARSERAQARLHLDPRAKLFMVFVISLIVLMTATTPLTWAIRSVITLVPAALLAAEGKPVSALGFGALYALALVLLRFFLSAGSSGMLASLALGYCGIVVQFLPAMIMAWYLVRTTHIGEFMSAMQRMHVPDGISISLAVVMRFFPTIREEYGAISDAMRMRGISLGGGSVGRMVEYRMIPLLFSCVNIGEELSAAAITRGLGGKVKRTSATELKLRTADWLAMIGFTCLFLIFVAAKYMKAL